MAREFKLPMLSSDEAEEPEKLAAWVRQVNAIISLEQLTEILRKLDNCRVNEDVLSFKKAAHQQTMKLWGDGSTKEILPTLRPTPMV